MCSLDGNILLRCNPWGSCFGTLPTPRFLNTLVSTCVAACFVAFQSPLVSLTCWSHLALIGRSAHSVPLWMCVCPEYLPLAVEGGLVALADIATAGIRFLTVAIATGLLDPPGTTIYDTYGPEKVDTPGHRCGTVCSW